MTQPAMYGRITAGVRRDKGRAGLVIYLAIAAIFLLFENFKSPIPANIRQIASDTATPVLSLLDEPIRAVQDGIVRLVGVGIIFEENQRLKNDNEQLLHWQSAALQLGRENERLRAILKGAGKEVPTIATGRVVGVGGGAFESSIIINVGKPEKVERNWPVVNEMGLVGRVITVGQLSSRVLLLTDLNSRVPVRVSRTGMLGILEGRNSAELRLSFLPADADIRIGDRIITSGHGSMFPPDLPVGEVIAVSQFGIGVRPVAYLDRLDYVRVLAYRFAQPEINLPATAADPVEEEGQQE